MFEDKGGRCRVIAYRYVVGHQHTSMSIKQREAEPGIYCVNNSLPRTTYNKRLPKVVAAGKKGENTSRVRICMNTHKSACLTSSDPCLQSSNSLRSIVDGHNAK